MVKEPTVKNKIKREPVNWAKILSPMFIVLITMIFTSGLIWATRGNPLKAYYYMIVGAFGSLSAFISTLNKAVPISFAGFAVAVSSKTGIFNIGIEGQLVFGALGSSLAGLYVTGLPGFVHIPICIVSGMFFGMLYALLPTLLYVKKGTGLLVIHIMMNNIANLLITYFVVGPFAGDNRMVASTNPIRDSAKLPYLITTPNKLTIGIIISIAVACILWLYLNKTTNGYELRTCGDNSIAAKFAGIKVKRYQAGALLASGALAGLAGSIEVLGTYHRLYDNFSPGYGFDGIPIAMLASGNPFGVLVGAFLFGVLRVGSLNMQSKAGVSSEIVLVIQGILITLIAAQYIIRFATNKLLNRKKKEERG